MDVKESSTAGDGYIPRIVAIDAWLDDRVSPIYKQQPLAQDWARVTKCSEEAGEAIDALILFTGQNPRKVDAGFKAELEDLLGELADVVITGMLAIQHFTKNGYITMDIIEEKLEATKERIPK